MPLIGVHESISGGPHKALSRGKDKGCEIVQSFTRFRLKWKAKELTDSEIEIFNKSREETGVIPVSIHSSYLINLSSPHREIRKKSYSLLLAEIEWTRKLNIPFLILHPGFHMGMGEERGLRKISDSISHAIAESEGSGVHILLETTSGQGTSLGWRFEHLRDIIDLSDKSEYLGVCFDTCHVFAAGYDFRNEEAYRQTMEKFDKVVGNKRLKFFHINDSKTELGSRIDRHNHPGKGNIGMKPFSFFLNDPEFTDHPFILETPKEVHNTGIDMDIINLKALKKLME